ncbi:SDR family NAD(P)-dependent oxidoreductase [Methylocaldum sp.]|uniref:SDR family NAD(P)-dependent oxidoreductase n=1 Tax=Methylocaldum sp. TaxID=1969727 RepID=UPI002D3DAA5B|nr:SDR family oxidoreductase [Methylocaldum sp.]HYE35264.1 SDR family oxidoreductase [Methylocaldum sp.]
MKRLLEGVGTTQYRAPASSPIPNMAPYVAAKHGVVGLTRAAAIEYSKQGVRVNAIAPGGVKTPMITGWLGDPALTQALIARHAIGRLAEPEEMSEAVLFLCSPGASFITGHVLLIDGGLMAH